jgi:hypothetical protein
MSVALWFVAVVDTGKQNFRLAGPMNDAEIVLNVRQLADDLRTLPPNEKLTSAAYKNLASQPGKGGPLTQWFNRETDLRKKRIISDIMGYIARASYQQKPEYFEATANDLEKLCDRMDAIE